jgi:membrane-bound lytic murein transglycosylase MltF
VRDGGLALLVVALLSGCASGLPKDPEGTLDRIRDEGVLYAGASPREPWVTLPEGTDGAPEGTEVELVEQFADGLGADVEWTASGEEELFGQLERGELDLVVGGLTAKSPHAAKAGVTRPYQETTGADGKTEAHVMMVRMGENALLVELERFLDQAATP